MVLVFQFSDKVKLICVCVCVCVCVRQVTSIVSDSLRPVDCGPPASSVYGILQARILEWVATPSSRGSSRPRDRTHVLYLLHWQEDSLPRVPPKNGFLWRWLVVTEKGHGLTEMFCV